jgi:hypothetical protein
MCRAAVSNLRRLRAVVSNPTSASAAAVSSPGRRRTQLHLQRSGEALATRRIYFAAGLFDAAFSARPPLRAKFQLIEHRRDPARIYATPPMA